MATIVVPPPDKEPWPTLGPSVCAFIEGNLVHGPGDLLGESVILSEELRAWIYRMYEVEPEFLFVGTGRGRRKERNPQSCRRRFRRVALSLRKGSSKTEIAAWIAACELHEDGPVRCVGFENGKPIPGPVSDPYIPMIAASEEQTEELAYGALRRILEISRLSADFDIGLDRITRIGGDGKAEAVSTSPKARDGARTTFQHADETHWFTLRHLKDGWRNMLANLPKRQMSDAWALETTTAPEPGSGSVAEATMDYAIELAKQADPSRARLFFFHREASPHHDLTTDDGLRAAILEASGPYIAAWSDIDGIVDAFREPDADLAYLERVWLNRCVQATEKAFDVLQWGRLADVTRVIPEGAPITIGFDGSRFDDATALVGSLLPDRHQFVIGLWERPANVEHWEVPIDEVDAAVADAFETWNVLRMYCDPPKWESYVSKWAGAYGDKRVVEWWTNRRKPMAYAIRAFTEGMMGGEISHDGDKRLAAHMGNACRMHTGLRDEEGQPLWVLRKDRPDSPHKIDLAMAAILSDEAARDCVAEGLVPTMGWVPV